MQGRSLGQAWHHAKIALTNIGTKIESVNLHAGYRTFSSKGFAYPFFASRCRFVRANCAGYSFGPSTRARMGAKFYGAIRGMEDIMYDCPRWVLDVGFGIFCLWPALARSSILLYSPLFL